MGTAIDNMKDQLLLVLVGRMGGDIVVPVSEIDDLPRGRLLKLQLIDTPGGKAFRFVLEKKQ